jgi:hypothetical protein
MPKNPAFPAAFLSRLENKRRKIMTAYDPNEPDLYLLNQLFGDRPSDQVGAPDIQPGSKEEATYKRQEQYWQEQRKAAAATPEAEIDQSAFEQEVEQLKQARSSYLYPEITRSDLQQLIERYILRVTGKYWTAFLTFVEEVHTREQMRLPFWLHQMLEAAPVFTQMTSDELYPETGE